MREQWRRGVVITVESLYSVDFTSESLECRIIGQKTNKQAKKKTQEAYFGLTFSLLIMASSESMDNERPCINLLASILA